MRNKGFVIIEILSVIVILAIVFIIFYGVMNEKPYFNQEQKMEWCMEEYEDFDYCKYKLGVEDEFRQSD